MLPTRFYNQSALNLAPALLGCELVHKSPEGVAAGMIVETEAYHADDAASHSFRGKTARNAVMFGPPGHVYVYLSYGVHYCMNVVGNGTTGAEAVLIRALEPTRGIALMERRRHTTERVNLCSGPGKLVQALGIGPSHNGARLTTPALHINPRLSPPRILASQRVGISRAVEEPWRFFIRGNRYVSKHKFNLSAVAYEHDQTERLST